MGYSDFHYQRIIKAVRKTKRCEQCGREIAVGSPAEYAFGKYDGDLYTTYTHVECCAAAIEYAKLNDAWGEDFPWFQHMENGEHEHHAWLLEHHPIVAERLGIDKSEAA